MRVLDEMMLDAESAPGFTDARVALAVDAAAAEVVDVVVVVDLALAALSACVCRAVLSIWLR
jgi:hypothetical protein